ncbi:MAG: ComEA family DNA-binding protein [Solirubrobacteraceae bacterium]
MSTTPPPNPSGPPGSGSGGDAAAAVRTRWMWWALLPFGLGAWVPAAAGLRARRPPWVALGVVASVVGITGLMLGSNLEDDSIGEGISYVASILAWIAGIVFAATQRATYAARVAVLRTHRAQDVAVDLRLEERDRARRLVARDPRRAIELGIGRPDVPGARHGGLIDVNRAPASVIATLPGADEELAARIAAQRVDTGPFTSLDELAFLLDLPPHVVDGLRVQAIAIVT